MLNWMMSQVFPKPSDPVLLWACSAVPVRDRQLQGRQRGARPRPRLPAAPRDGAAGPGSAGRKRRGKPRSAGTERGSAGGGRARLSVPAGALRCPGGCGDGGAPAQAAASRPGRGQSWGWWQPGRNGGGSGKAKGSGRRRGSPGAWRGQGRGLWPHAVVVVPARARGLAVSVQFIGPGPEPAMSELGQSGAPCAGAAGARGPCSWQPLGVIVCPASTGRSCSALPELFSHLPEFGHEICETRKLLTASKAVLERFYPVPCLWLNWPDIYKTSANWATDNCTAFTLYFFPLIFGRNSF